MSRFEGQIAYVTGAGSGIGRAAAERLAADGATVVLLGRREDALRETAAGIDGPSAVLPIDLSSSAAVADAFPAALEEHGIPDVVVHAAGQTIVGALHDLTDDQWDRQMDVNVRSIHLLTRATWTAMTAKGGAIVTVASTASHAAFPQDAAYVASKGAVLALTRAMALDGAGHGIRVNAVSPGYILTPNLQGYFDEQDDPAGAAASAGSASPLGRMGTPEEIASTIAFLASDDASFVTGASLLVDGGVLAQVPLS
ncbi:SDR family NAD(P)-dependent oxidoreductase [Patulibacter sp.]|uniref:SDR family NAD(P)-dependent oxidoreductase n=1 Tax=Patulibacter sp. TaxID=1912859 RepID=UPI002723393A|nr:SDR family NAD(P)-dependent oxidoreductase [Patulibacter sp.]MDO9407747.1 SDR family NAD(P)-dependent oxidoreductase [Patulibacter sp.]